MLPSIFEVSKVNAWCHWNEAVCVGAPIKTQIAVFILQRSLLFPILQMYSIHRDPVNIGTVSSPAGNLTVISFFSLKGCIFSNGSLKGIFFFFFWTNTTHLHITILMWNVIWFFKGVSLSMLGILNLSHIDRLAWRILCCGGVSFALSGVWQTYRLCSLDVTDGLPAPRWGN